jgi:hypothetical protein
VVCRHLLEARIASGVECRKKMSVLDEGIEERQMTAKAKRRSPSRLPSRLRVNRAGRVNRRRGARGRRAGKMPAVRENRRFLRASSSDAVRS